MIMSFAAPLGVGVTSAGEYFDMELTDDSLSSKEMENRLNATMAEGMKVISVRQISDGKASACMSLVAAADYTVAFREGKEPSVEWKKGQLEAFFAQDSIEILRKTKRSEKITDIKPWIYKLELRGDKVWMQLSQGSVQPETGISDGSIRKIPRNRTGTLCTDDPPGRSLCRPR